MAFQPDIIVTTPNGVLLVVEAKVTQPNLERAEEQLKQYVLNYRGRRSNTGGLR
jgi:DNA anti-recombination protein RmuC